MAKAAPKSTSPSRSSRAKPPAATAAAPPPAPPEFPDHLIREPYRKPASPGRFVLVGLAGACALGVGAGLWARPALSERRNIFQAASLAKPQALRQIQIVLDDSPAPLGAPLDVMSEHAADIHMPAFVPPAAELLAPVRPPAGLVRVDARAEVPAALEPAPVLTVEKALAAPAPKPVAKPPAGPTPAELKIAADKAKARLAWLAKVEARKAEAAKAEKLALAKAEKARLETVRVEKIKAEKAKAAKATLVKAKTDKAEKLRLAKLEAAKSQKVRAAEAKAEKARLAKAKSEKVKLAKNDRGKSAPTKAQKVTAEKARLAEIKQVQLRLAQLKAAQAKAMKAAAAKTQKDRKPSRLAAALETLRREKAAAVAEAEAAKRKLAQFNADAEARRRADKARVLKTAAVKRQAAALAAAQAAARPQPVAAQPKAPSSRDTGLRRIAAVEVDDDPGEALVRRDPQLAAAERQLNRAYRNAEAAGVSQAQLRRQQRRWLAARSSAAREAPWAVHDVYDARIAELDDQARDAQGGY